VTRPAGTAIVTGAGQGLGEAIARRLAADGAHVVVVDISADRAEHVARQLPSAAAVTLDVRDTDGLARLVRQLHADRGSIDILVNNAAVTPNTSLWEIGVGEWDDVLQVNLRSCFFACQIVGKLMQGQRSGRIVNLTSLAGQQGGLVSGAHYAASKAGIVVLTKIFARELAGHGVTVNAVAPAAIDGPVMQTLTPERIRSIGDAIPVGRIGRPEEIAATVAFLCSDDAAYLTGATIDVNGGLFMR
jgi:3-oxoacyl-[acyl-carrier protein] reductase